MVPCNPNPKPLVGLSPGRATDPFLFRGRQMKVPGANLPEVDRVAGVGDEEIDVPAMERMIWLLAKELEQLTAALPPVANALLPLWVGVCAWGGEGWTGTARPWR